METQKMKWTILLSLAVFAVMATGGISKGDTHYVYDSEDLYNIQHSPDLGDGDTIKLMGGTFGIYYGYSPIDPPSGKHIIYEGPATLDGGSPVLGEYAYLPCIYLGPGDSAEVNGMTIKCGFIIPCNQYKPWDPNGGFTDKGSVDCEGTSLNKASLTLSNCTFRGGLHCAKNPYDVRAIYCQNSDIVLENCDISISNLHSSEAQAVKITGNSNVRVYNCNISENNGRAIDLQNKGDVYILGCTINDNNNYNYSTYGAGGIYINHSDINVWVGYCTLSGNSTKYGDGGAICNISCGKTNIYGCTITSNKALSGGGIYIQDLNTIVEICGCEINGNTARDGAGGGIYNYGEWGRDPHGMGTRVKCSIISGNEALGPDGKGGGIYSYGNLHLDYCVIIGNDAEKDGGGLWINDDETTRGYIDNCTGSLRFDKGFSGIGSSTVACNYAGQLGGGGYFSGTGVGIGNNIFWYNGNGGAGAGEIYGNSNVGIWRCDISQSHVAGGLVIDDISDSILGFDGGNNIDADPCFIDYDPDPCNVSYDYIHIGPNSPCIDAGGGEYWDGLLAGADYGYAADIDGETRWNGVALDIGADEVAYDSNFPFYEPNSNESGWELDKTGCPWDWLTAYDKAGENDGNLIGDPEWIGTPEWGWHYWILDFDGTGDYVSIDHNDSLNYDTFTISAWVYRRESGKEWQTIIDKSGGSSSNGGYALFVDASDKVVVSLADGAAPSPTFRTYNSLPANQWVYVAATFNGGTVESGDIKVYFNGVEQQGQERSYGTTLKTNTRNLYIGTYEASTGTTGKWNGMMDDVLIFRSALTATQIEYRYWLYQGFRATEPEPADEATTVNPNTVLRWVSHRDAVSHDVYFGTDYVSVRDANINSQEYMATVDVNSFDPGELELLTTYYWRIDEKYPHQVDPVRMKGEVWSFTTWDVEPEPEPNLVRWWKFDESNGTTAYDSAGSNNGTLVYMDPATDWVEGQIYNALDFDGSNDYVSIPSYTVSTDKGTISLWFKTSANFSGNYGGMGYLMSRDNQWYSYLTIAGDGTGAYWIIGETDSQDDYFVAKNGAAPKGQWNHLAVSFDEKEATTYINGSFVETRQVTNSSLTLTRIGGRMYEYFNGRIDDIRIYDKALSGPEIEQLHWAGRGYKAFSPNPCNGATGVNPDTVLSWSPGKDAASHDVYFGTDYDDVNNADKSSPAYKGTCTVNNFDPCATELGLETTYYWRVDENNPSGTTKGEVWCFTTWVEPNLVRWWKLDEGEGGTAHDSASGQDGTINEATWNEYGELHFDGSNDYVTIPSYTVSTDKGTISLWFKTSANFSGNYGGMGYLISRDNQYYSYLTVAGNGTGAYWIIGETNSQDDYFVAKNGAAPAGRWDHLAVSFDEKEATTYINGEFVETRPVTNSSLTLTRIGGRTTEFFNGEIKDVRIYDRALSEEEIEQLDGGEMSLQSFNPMYRVELSEKASNPNPANGATGVSIGAELSWTAGELAETHDVYLGTDYDDVNDANVSSAEYKGNYDVNTFGPGTLSFGTTYYWRVDEKNGAGVTTGDVWSFTTRTGPAPNIRWQLDETSGTIAHDYISGKNGTFNGSDPCWTDGLIGGAVDFDGVSDYFSVSSLDNAYSNSSVFTVAGWFKTSQSTGIQTIVGQWSQDYEAGQEYYGWQVLVENNKVIARFGNEIPTYDVTGTSTVNNDEWHHFVMVRNGLNSVALYVDGQPQRTAGAINFMLYNTKFRIGDGSACNGYPPTLKGGPFNGVIDDVMLFNRALSAEEIGQLAGL